MCCHVSVFEGLSVALAVSVSVVESVLTLSLCLVAYGCDCHKPMYLIRVKAGLVSVIRLCQLASHECNDISLMSAESVAAIDASICLARMLVFESLTGDVSKGSHLTVSECASGIA